MKEKKWFKILTLAVSICAVITFSAKGILKDYPYWLDELFTIQFITGTWKELFTVHLLPDTHPPLYFVLAKIWASIFGSQASALRTLSSLFSVATVILLWKEWEVNLRDERLILLLLIAFNPYFLYYSQEARSYSLMIGLATIATVMTINGLTQEQLEQKNGRFKEKQTLNKPLILVSLCLSLVHYFGFIYSAVLSITRACFRKGLRYKLREGITLMVISIWPVLHLGIYGTINGSQLTVIQLEQQDWWRPIFAFNMSCLPFFNTGNQGLDFVTRTSFILVSAYALKTIFTNKQLKYPFNATKLEVLYSAFIIGTSLLLISILNHKTPISTIRNFTVFIPVTCMLLSGIFNISASYNEHNEKRAKQKIFIGIYLGLILIVSLKITSLNISKKIFAYQKQHLMSNQMLAKSQIKSSTKTFHTDASKC